MKIQLEFFFLENSKQEVDTKTRTRKVKGSNGIHVKKREAIRDRWTVCLAAIE